MQRRRFLGYLPALLPALWAQPLFCSPLRPDFSGTWKQSNERSSPRRSGEVTLRIEDRDPDIIVETTVLKGAGQPRRALQRYRTDGQTTVSTGADGDEFHTAVTWSGPTLLFAIEEHEDGRILLSKETWTLEESGTILRRLRERASDNEKQILIYLR